METASTDKYSTKLYRYSKGEIIVKEGDHSSIIYFLMDGILGVYKGEEKVAEISGKGLVFGEMSSILQQPRSTSVVAEIESDIMVYRGGIQSITKKFPHIAIKIMAMLAERLEDMNARYHDLQILYSAEQAKLRDALKEIETLKAQLNQSAAPLRQPQSEPEMPKKGKYDHDRSHRYLDDGYVLGYPSKKFENITPADGGDDISSEIYGD